MLAKTQSSSFLHHNRRVKSLPAITVHHVTTAADMNAPVLIAWGVERVQLVTVVEHLPAGSGQHSRPLDERGHNYGSSTTVDLPKKLSSAFVSRQPYWCSQIIKFSFLSHKKNSFLGNTFFLLLPWQYRLPKFSACTLVWYCLTT